MIEGKYFQSGIGAKNVDKKIRFLTNFSIFDKNFRFLTKIFDFYEIFRFLTKIFDFRQNFSIFDKIFDFWQNFRFLTKFSIFDKIFDFWQNFRFLTKIFDLWQKIFDKLPPKLKSDFSSTFSVLRVQVFDPTRFGARVASGCPCSIMILFFHQFYQKTPDLIDRPPVIVQEEEKMYQLLYL